MKIYSLLVIALLGCATVRSHPFATSGIVNSAIVTAAGVCAVECSGNARGASESVLIGELALSSTLAMWMMVWFIAETSR